MVIPKSKRNFTSLLLLNPYGWIVVGAFIWIGFVSSISFMEAWLKFRAPHVSLQIGVGIGQLVFNALNKVEWFLAIAMAVSFFGSRKRVASKEMYLFAIPLVILAVQTLFLLPILNQRAEMVLQGSPVPSSSIHVYYLSLEAAKVACLFFLGVFILKGAEFFKERSQAIRSG